MSSSHNRLTGLPIFGAASGFSPPMDSNNPLLASTSPKTTAVAYTTVGSVVDPNNAPKFSAPNRIQREGASRRSLASILRDHDIDAVVQTHLPPTCSPEHTGPSHLLPPASRNPLQNITNSRASCTIDLSPQSLTSSDLNTAQLQQRSHSVTSTRHSLQSQDTRKGTLYPEIATVEELAEEEALHKQAKQAGEMSDPLKGMEKMTTLTRLSRFPNPAQQAALSRLREFSVAKIRSATERRQNAINAATASNSDAGSAASGTLVLEGQTYYDMASRSYSNAGSGLNPLTASFMTGNSYGVPDAVGVPAGPDTETEGDGQNADIRPPPGFRRLLQPQDSRASRQRSVQAAHTRSSGLPQPLTAGPPGQRHFQSTMNQPAPQAVYGGQYDSTSHELLHYPFFGGVTAQQLPALSRPGTNVHATPWADQPSLSMAYMQSRALARDVQQDSLTQSTWMGQDWATTTELPSINVSQWNGEPGATNWQASNWELEATTLAPERASVEHTSWFTENRNMQSLSGETLQEVSPTSQVVQPTWPSQANAQAESVTLSDDDEPLTSNVQPHNGHMTLWGTSFNNSAQAVFPHNGFVATDVVDTLSPQDAAKYYPHGFPPDITGAYKPISAENLLKMAMTQAERDAQKHKALEDWFYDGQGRFLTMTAEDLLNENDLRKNATKSYGPIAPPRKPVAKADVTPVSIKDLQETSTAEVSRPMMDHLYGTLLNYSDRHTPGSHAQLSRFADNPSEHIDASAEGNKTMFGEDWGVPVKREPSSYQGSAANSRAPSRRR